jgi:uncharacterized protein (DUF952 family)
MTIFHIASAAAWKAARAAGSYAPESLATEGFIHCSTAEQFIWVANQRFVGRTDLVLLHIDPAKLAADVVYENLEGGTRLFPHVYGPIPLGAVILVSPLMPGPDGRFGA